MPNSIFPDLRCVGFNKENCTGMVVNKTQCLCQTCYMRRRYHNLSPAKLVKEKERKKNWHAWKKDFGLKTKQRKKLTPEEAQNRRTYYSLYQRGGKPAYTFEEFFTWHTNASKACKYCTSPANTLDHIIPLSKGGTHALDNLQLICERCNRAKWDSSEEEFLAWLKILRL